MSLLTRRLQIKQNMRYRTLLNTGSEEVAVNDSWGAAASLPDNWTLNKTWTSGGDDDLDTLIAGASTPVFSGFDINDDGTKVIITNASDDEGHSYSLSTPWDFSTATALTTPLGLTNSVCAQWLNDGALYGVLFGSTDVNYILEMAVQWVLEGGNDGSTAIANWGFDDTETGPTQWVKDGTSFYWTGEDQTNDAVIRKGTVAVPYYHDGVPVAETVVSINATFGNVSHTNDSLKISSDEKYVLYSDNGVVQLGTMSTPGDITTLTFGAEKCTTGQVGPIHVNDAFTKMWIASNNTLQVEIEEWDIPV